MESPITEISAKSSLLKTDSIDVVDCEFFFFVHFQPIAKFFAFFFQTKNSLVEYHVQPIMLI